VNLGFQGLFLQRKPLQKVALKDAPPSYGYTHINEGIKNRINKNNFQVTNASKGS
jgi:hypothetical protein